jgi:hypothetical protein
MRPGYEATTTFKAHYTQSAKLFSSRRNWDSPNPSPPGKCAPPFGSGGWGMHSLAREGGGRVSIPARGHTL